MSKIETIYKTIEIAYLLALDDSEYDTSMTGNKLMDMLDGIMITKIMGFDENYDEANKYMLSIIKNIYKDDKYEKYKKNIFDVLKNIFFGDLNNEYLKTLILNFMNYKNKHYFVYCFEYLSEKEFFEFILVINNLQKSLSYELLNIITKSYKLRNFLLKKSIDGHNYEKNINLISLLRFRDDFNINDEEYIPIIENYLSNDKSTEEIIDYINDILEKNKILGSTTLSFSTIDYKSISSIRFLALTLKICLFMFEKMNKNNIFNNIERDFNSTQRKEYLSTIDDTIETKIYLMALRGFRIIHNSIIILYTEAKNTMDTLSIFGFQQKQNKEKFLIIKELIFSNSLDILIKNLIDYYTQEFLQINNEAVDTIIQYYFNMKKIKKDYNYPKESINYFYKLLATSSEYCNQHYKFDVLTLICNIYDKKDSEVENNMDLLKAIILYHDENDMFKSQEREIAYKYYQKSLIILEKILSKSNIEENSMNDLFLKFFYRTNSHTITHLEFLDLVCTEIGKKINDHNEDTFRTQFIIMVREVMKSINISLKVVNIILTKNILNPAIFKGEIILPIITLATNVLKFFTNGKIAIYSVFNMNFEALDIMKFSLYVLHRLTVNDDFKDLIQDSKNIIIDSLPYIKFHEFEKHIKDELKENLQKTKDDIKLEDIPEEFLDPLIYTLIKDPVMIPNVDLIFDKTSIMSQIYHEKINPYTRESLDENIIQIYNKKPDIIEKVAEFLDRINKWKYNNI